MSKPQFKMQNVKCKGIASLFALCTLLFALAVMPACRKHGEESQAQAALKILYHCGMHPQIISDKSGECPICHMKLIPIEPAVQQGSATPRQVKYYRNPMDPSVTSPAPMKDAMGMDYIPVYS